MQRLSGTDAVPLTMTQQGRNNHKGVSPMTDAQIISLFDSSNITLAELSAISGRSVAALKKLLMGG